MNPESTFTNSKGETMSFIDYYKRQYQIDIQDRKQPLLVNRPTLKKRGVAEAEADRVVCLIPGKLCFDEKNSATQCAQARCYPKKKMALKTLQIQKI